MKKITLDGVEKQLKYTWASIERLEEEFGISLLEVFANGEKIQKLSTSPKSLRLALWAGLIHEDKTLKPEALISLLNLKDTPKLIQTLIEAFMGDMDINNG